MLNQFDLQNRPLLEGIQGNILKSHGRHHTINLFIRGHDDEASKTSARAWLRSLVEGEEPVIKSAYAQLRSNALFKDSDGKIDTGLFACIHISAAGYNYLFGANASNRFGDASFRNGMRNAGLNDPADVPWQEYHFMLLLAHANPNELALAHQEIEADILAFANVPTTEPGEALFNQEGAGIEHFGYVDGVSQPLFFEDEWESYQANNNIQNEADIRFDPRAEPNLVLTDDPFAPGAFGSYFVFRKLEQNVRGFKRAEEHLANQLNLIGEDRERAGAMLVGRFEDGTPVEISEEAGMIRSAVVNNFDYSLADASRCPYHAHIRKTNPRSSMPPEAGGMEQAKSHIMARRGIPFGGPRPDLNDGRIGTKPEGGVGLLFMSYQASIQNQFEFIQRFWANNPVFPNLNPEKPDGLDPIIGQGDGTRTGEFPTVWNDPASQQPASFAQFVMMRGGEYFFAPSMAFLRSLPAGVS